MPLTCIRRAAARAHPASIRDGIGAFSHQLLLAVHRDRHHASSRARLRLSLFLPAWKPRSGERPRTLAHHGDAIAGPAYRLLGRFAPRAHRGKSILWAEGSEVSWRSRRWSPDKSSRAAGQVFEPDPPLKSLHVRGRRSKTKTLVSGPTVERASDVPSNPCGGESSQAGSIPVRLREGTLEEPRARSRRAGCGPGPPRRSCGRRRRTPA
jgi:hypothetical protein